MKRLFVTLEIRLIFKSESKRNFSVSSCAKLIYLNFMEIILKKMEIR
mgnify:CR=1 FL=1